MRPIYNVPLVWVLGAYSDVAKQEIVMVMLHLIYYICGTGTGIKTVLLHISTDKVYFLFKSSNVSNEINDNKYTHLLNCQSYYN